MRGGAAFRAPSHVQGSDNVNARKERFCLEYAASGNATQAAIAAGYSSKTARSQGQRLLTNVDIKTRIEEIQQETRREKNADIDAICQRHLKMSIFAGMECRF